MKYLLYLFLLAVFIFDGCSSKTNLEGTAEKLKAGMNQQQVSLLFANFGSSPSSGFEGILKNISKKSIKTVAFHTNNFIGTTICFAPKDSGFFKPFELCTLYFDTNGIIAGYHYNIDR